MTATETRTEYAIKSTALRHGKSVVVIETLPGHETDQEWNERVVQERRDQQIDAALVTRTVTISEWADAPAANEPAADTSNDTDALRARGRALLEARTTQELCDMYVHALAERDKSTGNDFQAACMTLCWIAEILQHRDSAACDRWYEAEEVIEADMLARDEWIAGASSLPPHTFFGCDTYA